MLWLFLILVCEPGEAVGDLGIRIDKVGETLHMAISPDTLTVELSERLKLSDGQVRIISRIVLDTTANAENAGCNPKKADHGERHIRTILRRMDRCIEKQLSPRQRARYQALKKERGKKLLLQQTKAD